MSAEGGDVAAARKLRAWLDSQAQRKGDRNVDLDLATTYGELSNEQQSALKARLLRDAVELERQLNEDIEAHR